MSRAELEYVQKRRGQALDKGYFGSGRVGVEFHMMENIVYKIKNMQLSPSDRRSLVL